MDISTEKLILGSLITNTEFIGQALPFIKPEYFHDKLERIVFETIAGYISKYQTKPNATTLLIDLRNTKLNDIELTQAQNIVREVHKIETPSDFAWLAKQAEKFCQDKAVYNAIMKSINIYDGDDKTTPPTMIPDMLRDAVSISFDTKVGMDFLDDANARWDYYTQPLSKHPFDINILNTITNGGVESKTLNIVLSGINVGKTLSLCYLAGMYAKLGYDVLYISLEMSEEQILKRIDANVLGIPINSFAEYGRTRYMSKIDRIKESSFGRIKVKQYPPGSANVMHFKSLLNDLKLKQNFVPKVILVDYLGLVGSYRLKAANTSSYFYLKAVAEEVRGLFIELDVVGWSAFQLNRAAQSSTDAEMSDISESLAVAATMDFAIALAQTEELVALNQIHGKQLKNRYGDKNTNSKFLLGLDLMLQRIYNVMDSEQKNVSNHNYSKQPTPQQPKNKFAALN